MPKKSAGFLLYRDTRGRVEVFLVHPGGPFWARKDEGAWSIPKGEFSDDEDPLEAAKREFEEETSFTVEGNFRPLRPLKQPSGKVVFAWMVEGDLDETKLRSNTCPVEWPRGSGKMIEIPEVDRGGWFSIEVARVKIVEGQVGFLDQFEGALAAEKGKVRRTGA